MSAIRDPERQSRNVICCLLALEIVDYAAKPVFDQIRLTQDFQQLLFDATAQASSHDLVSMLREDGALLSFLADPEQCLTTALTIREAMLTQDRYRDLPLRIGINLGRAQIAEDDFGNPYVSGEGRQDADRLIRQGPPGQISVARQFVELLSRSAPELAQLLEYQGLHSDTVGPPLCLYRVSAPQDAASDRFSDQPPTLVVSSGVIDAPKHSAPLEVFGESTAKRQDALRRSWLGYALLSVLAAAAMVTWSSRLRVEPLVSRQAVQVATATPRTAAFEAAEALGAPVAPPQINHPAVTTPAVLANDPMRPRPVVAWRAKPRKEAAPAPRTFKKGAALEERSESERTASPSEATRAASVHGPRSATLLLAVKPWGEVYVDGRKIGVTPPLKRFELPPGLRLVTITNSSLPDYQRRLTVHPGAQMTVAHDFDCISNREKTCREGFGKGLELRSSFSFQTAAAGRSR